MRKLMLIAFIAFAFLLLHSNITMAYENEIRSLSNAMAENIAVTIRYALNSCPAHNPTREYPV